MVIEINTEINLHIFDEGEYEQGDPLPLQEKKNSLKELMSELEGSKEENQEKSFTMGDNPLPVSIKFNTKDLVYYSATYPDGDEGVVLLVNSSIFHLKSSLEEFEKSLLQKLSIYREIHETMNDTDTDWYIFLTSKYTDEQANK